MKKIVITICFVFLFFCVFSIKVQADIVAPEWMHEKKDDEYSKTVDTPSDWDFMDNNYNGDTLILPELEQLTPQTP